MNIEYFFNPLNGASPNGAAQKDYKIYPNVYKKTC